MAENLLNRVIHNEVNLVEFIEWLTQPYSQDVKFQKLSSQYQCTRPDFVTFFLNFVHEEIGDKNVTIEDSKSSSELNRSQSFPLDVSSGNESTSTPKMDKVRSDSSMLYMSPISPIYKHSFSTPKQKLCLGDFITKSSSKQNKKRIKPTNLSQSKIDSFNNSQNSFNFNESCIDEVPQERNFLMEEKAKILAKLPLNSSKRIFSLSEEIKPEIESISFKQEIEKLIRIFIELLDKSYVLNLTSEIYFLISLLIKKQRCNNEWGIGVLREKITIFQLFNSIHNVIYFACKCLEMQISVLKNYDNSTIRLLVENERIKKFTPKLVEELSGISKPDRTLEILPTQNNICFNSDTDNRQNFPNDLSFHAFKKQRDLFYEILRIWELHHTLPDFAFISLSGKIRSLLSLSKEATNFVHFCRLFKNQLLHSYNDKNDFVTSLNVDVDKLNKLKNRCVNKGSQGLNALPVFNESEEFYKDFIICAANASFNRHLCDCFIEEITELNESNFGSDQLEQEDSEDVDLVTKKSYYTCIKKLRIVAKFLGFVESLPYKTEANYNENLRTAHLKIRKLIQPNFDVKSLLESSIRKKSVILCVPWLIKYLSMLDSISLRLPYYNQIHSTLFWLYRNFDWAPEPNVYLVRFCLGWLFELAHIPDNNFLYFCTNDDNQSVNTSVKSKLCLDQLELVDQDILYFCCPYLDEIKKLLVTTPTCHVSVKHITPVTAVQSPEEMAKKKLEQQLEEAFFNGQPISLRKTVEFVSERVASTCVKHICNNLVPTYKKTIIEKFRSTIKLNQEENLETQKATLLAKSNDLAGSSLIEFKQMCDDEILAISGESIEKAIDALVAFDVLKQTKMVCVGIAKKSCLERVGQWVDSHVTLGVFMKDLNDEIQKIIDPKKQMKPVFMLPPGGTNSKHSENTPSPAHLLENFRELTINVLECNRVTQNDILTLLDDTSKSVADRGDFNQCILAAICTQLVDLTLILLSYDTSIVTSSKYLSASCDIWRLHYSGCEDLFKSLLCHRNVKIFSKSPNTKLTWNAFAKFCAYLIKHGLLSCEVFESQCTGIFRTNWDQATLKVLTEFFKVFGGLYRDQGGSASDFTFLLDFFSDYCEDLI